MSNYIDQGALAEKAFAEYEFGDGVMVTDTSGWEYTTPGNERTRKVYVETEREDDGPAPRWVLNFTVRFDPASGALSEAYAMDEKGQIWGNMASQREVHTFASGDWTHLFGVGSKETRCRIVIDLEQSKLIAAQEWTGLKFEGVHGDRLKDLAESVIEVNEAHTNLDDWNSELTNEIPEWVAQRNVQKGQL